MGALSQTLQTPFGDRANFWRHAMQAAVLSALLLAGACGAMPGETGCDGAGCGVVGCGAVGCGAVGCGAVGSGGTIWSPVTRNGIVTYGVGPLGCPWYSPLWFCHGCDAFYPAHYATPYDYREQFDYPWNGPRPAMPVRAASFEELAPERFSRPPLADTRRLPASTAWPAATAAEYLRQSPARIASKNGADSR